MSGTSILAQSMENEITPMNFDLSLRMRDEALVLARALALWETTFKSVIYI